MWLEAASNKYSETVGACFDRATQEHGVVPDQVRCDKGKENSTVISHMFLLCGNQIHNPVLTGCSVHNTRIERLWRDIHRLVVWRFKDIFYDLENSNDLDVDSYIDIWCLH